MNIPLLKVMFSMPALSGPPKIVTLIIPRKVEFETETLPTLALGQAVAQTIDDETTEETLFR